MRASVNVNQKREWASPLSDGHMKDAKDLSATHHGRNKMRFGTSRARLHSRAMAKDMDLAVRGIHANLWRSGDRLMRGDKCGSDRCVIDEVVARLRSQTPEVGSIKLNLKQLLVQREFGLIGPEKSNPVASFVKLDNLTRNKPFWREIDRFDISIEGAQLPRQPSGLLCLMKKGTAVRQEEPLGVVFVPTALLFSENNP